MTKKGLKRLEESLKGLPNLRNVSVIMKPC